MSDSRADRLIRRRLGEAIDSPAQAEAMLAKYHYLPDPRRRKAEEGWYAHELGHKALVVDDPTFGVRWQLYQAGDGGRYSDFKSGTGLLPLEGALTAAHTRTYP